MWTIYKYLINNIDQNFAEMFNNDKTISIPERILNPIKDYVQKHTENYLISFHYVDFPIIISYGKKVPETDSFKIYYDYVEPYKEVIKILMGNKEDYIYGFNFIKKNIEIRKYILNSPDLETFDLRSATSGLEPFIINDLRTLWKNNRFLYLNKALIKKEEILCEPNIEHPLYNIF